MKSKFTWILTLFIALIVQVGFAQKPVTGVVKTQDGDPIPGASVMLVGTNLGTGTDSEGRYTLTLKKGDRIEVHYEGFKSTTVTVSDSGILNVTLVEDDSYLIDEIIVDAYRTTSKEQSAVAASTVTSKTIEGRPNASFIQTLQGQVPGLNIATGSGQPGANNTTVILRGLGSITGSVEPLYVIDGVPMSSDRFRSLNPNDIESINVLKDAGATAIYGNRGANGVIVITTKRASFDSALSVKYVGTTSLSVLQDNNYELFNGPSYKQFVNQAKRDYPSANFTAFSQAQLNDPTSFNWVDEFFRDAISQNHTLSFSAGSKNLASFTSVGYADYEGVLKHTDLKRFNFRSNLNGKNNSGRLNFGTNVSANFSKSSMVQGHGTAYLNDNYFMGAVRSLPYLTPDLYKDSYESADALLREYGNSAMPFLLMDKRRTNGFSQDEFKILVNGNINYKLNDDFTVGTQIGADYQTITQDEYYAPDSWNAIYGTPLDQEFFGIVSGINEDRVIVNSTTSLKWNKIFNEKHTINAGAYVEYIKAHFKNSSFTRRGFDPIFFTPGTTAGAVSDVEENDYYVPSAGLTLDNAGLFSYFATANYDFDRRYGVDATIRRDASYRFTADNRWGTFWSVAGRWNISNESFMENSVFNNLKIRASYGKSGNQDILGTGIFGASGLYNTLYSTGIGYKEQSALSIAQLPNRNLQWEVITQTNIGLDFGLWNDRLRGSLDFYRKQTDDLYLPRQISAINGATSILSNYGSLKNEGVELIIAGDVIRNNKTTLTLNANGSYNKNEVLNLPNEEGYYWNTGSLVGHREGGKVNELYVVTFAGIDPQNGNMMFYDKNGNITYEPNDNDRKWTGKSSLPVYQGGFGLDFDHNGWFVNANFTYAFDVWRYDNDYFFLTHPTYIKTANMSADVLDYWTPTNTDASFPRLAGSNISYAGGTDFYIKDASYVRLRYLSLGYNFKKKDLDFIKLTGLRVYAQGENLHTWSKWKGWDAESNRSVDLSQYPTPKTFSVGVEVQF